MRFIFLIALFIFIMPVSAKADDFIPYMDSVPLMQGFTASAEDALIFDKPEGRLVEIDIWCESNCPDNAAITDYYTDGLRILGWTHTGNLEFTKNDERIQMDIFSAEGGVQKIIRFRSNG